MLGTRERSERPPRRDRSVAIGSRRVKHNICGYYVLSYSNDGEVISLGPRSRLEKRDFQVFHTFQVNVSAIIGERPVCPRVPSPGSRGAQTALVR